MDNILTYRVGDHLFGLDIKNYPLSGKELANYTPFRIVCFDRDDLLFTLELLSESEVAVFPHGDVARFEDENGCMTLCDLPDGLSVQIALPSGDECLRLFMDRNYRLAKAWLGGDSSVRRYSLDTALMLLYAFASARYDTLLMHASAVESGGRGYIFLGKSGTGKSTHSRMWLENIEGAQLLNDDNPIVRIVDGFVNVYGSPWSGKTPCYRNNQIPLGAIVRLHQASENNIELLSGVKAYAAILPSCSCIKWDPSMSEAVHRTVGNIIGSVPVFGMRCLPDASAAKMCKKAIADD